MTALSVDDIVALAGGRIEADDLSASLELEGATLLHGSRGEVIIADTQGATPLAMSAALKMLVQVVPSTSRSIAVLGALDVAEAEANEAHDAIGRLVVRLNISQLIVVGHEARHIHNAAGLEGSWDGESKLVGTAREAYDLLRETLAVDDVVLVKSSRRGPLDDLAGWLSGTAS